MAAILLEFRGELAALGSALIWSIAAIVYTTLGQQFSPLILNFTKGWLALGMLILTLLPQLILGHTLPPQAMTLLIFSGAMGIGLGDTAYFAALNCIGPRRSLLITSLSPGLTALLSWQFLQEALSLAAWLGIALTLGGVVWVTLERSQPEETRNLRYRRGVIMAILAAVGQAIGAVLSRAALLNSSVDPLWSTLLRLGGGTIVLFGWILIQRQAREITKPLHPRRIFATIAITAFFSTYIGIWLQQVAFKHTAAGIAQALNSTSPLFILPFALFLGDRLSLRAILGALTACGGVWLLFQGR
ncbi:DMT family transporter [Alkalinema sp. FACHB-956]|uniref:DMT family transporter n=1 Tax=Alkalinema sp. FACHB-956 TaxID=2692768 RepID=UPI001685BD87|nr:DMT family transporter [Alkalinema sp. FACHB-956]MBD2328750.1 DMT family transporter [Alkalinema sp. FACHB-956]